MNGISIVQKEMTEFVSDREIPSIRVVIGVYTDHSRFLLSITDQEAGQVVIRRLLANHQAQQGRDFFHGHRRGVHFVAGEKLLHQGTDMFSAHKQGYRSRSRAVSAGMLHFWSAFGRVLRASLRS